MFLPECHHSAVAVSNVGVTSLAPDIPAEFLSFYGLLNFYLYTLAFVYSPSKNALYGQWSNPRSMWNWWIVATDRSNCFLFFVLLLRHPAQGQPCLLHAERLGRWGHLQVCGSALCSELFNPNFVIDVFPLWRSDYEDMPLQNGRAIKATAKYQDESDSDWLALWEYSSRNDPVYL